MIEMCYIANSWIVWIYSFRREKDPAGFSHRYFHFLVSLITLPHHSPTCVCVCFFFSQSACYLQSKPVCVYACVWSHITTLYVEFKFYAAAVVLWVASQPFEEGGHLTFIIVYSGLELQCASESLGTVHWCLLTKVLVSSKGSLPFFSQFLSFFLHSESMGLIRGHDQYQ